MLAQLYEAAKKIGRPDDRARRSREQCHGIDLLEWSFARGGGAPSGLFSGPPRPEHEPPPGLYEPLRAGGVFELDGADLASVLDALAKRCAPHYRHARAELLGKLRTVGDGGFLVTRDALAVSHPRRPIILPVAEPIMTIGFAEIPILLSAKHEHRVQVFINLVCPTVNTHLALLTQLSRLLSRGRFVGLLDGRHTREEILDHVWLHDCGLDQEEIVLPSGFAD